MVVTSLQLQTKWHRHICRKFFHRSYFIQGFLMLEGSAFKKKAVQGEA